MGEGGRGVGGEWAGSGYLVVKKGTKAIRKCKQLIPAVTSQQVA